MLTPGKHYIFFFKVIRALPSSLRKID